MRISLQGIVLTKRNQNTRNTIGAALISLMQHKEFEYITVTMIVRKAKVSRMTFYNYYKTKAEVLKDYMYEIVTKYMIERKERSDSSFFLDYSNIIHFLNFFSKYEQFFHVMIKANMYSIIIEAVNDYMIHEVHPTTNEPVYKLYYYGGAFCNLYIQWIENGKKESAEEIAHIIYDLILQKPIN